MLAQRRRQWPRITAALGQCIVCSSVSGAGLESVTRIVTGMQQSENAVQRFNAVSIAGQRRKLWVNIETALGECHVLAQSIHQTNGGFVLAQRRRQLTGIDPAMGCDAGPTWNRNLVRRPTSSVQGTS